MRQYPIWNVMHGLPYKGSKDFGANGSGYSQSIYVGTSSRNSNKFADIDVKRICSGDNTIFQIVVDDVVVKETTFNKKWEQVTEPAREDTPAFLRRQAD